MLASHYSRYSHTVDSKIQFKNYFFLTNEGMNDN